MTLKLVVGVKWEQRKKIANIKIFIGNQRLNKVLEVGAGDGGILSELNNLANIDTLFALEISNSGLNKIKERKLNKLKKAELFNGYEMPFENSYFNLAVLSHVLEPVKSERQLLREIKSSYNRSTQGL